MNEYKEGSITKVKENGQGQQNMRPLRYTPGYHSLI